MILTINSYLFFRPIKHKFVLEVSCFFLRQAQSFLRFVYLKKKKRVKGLIFAYLPLPYTFIYIFLIPTNVFFFRKGAMMMEVTGKQHGWHLKMVSCLFWKVGWC